VLQLRYTSDLLTCVPTSLSCRFSGLPQSV
jgi:hypothetical protein